MSNRIFSNPGADLTLIPHFVFDYIMPTLSGDAWKVLCVAIRQTFSVEVTDASQWIDMPEFMQNAGLPERRDAEKALQECVYAGYLIEAPQSSASAQPHYALNTKFDIRGGVPEPAPVESPASKKPKPKSPAKPAAKKRTPTTPLSDEKQEAMDAFVRFAHEMGVTPDPTQLRDAVLNNPSDAILAWIELGQGMTHLGKSARFKMVLERLLAGVPPLPLSMLGAEVEEDEGAEDEGAEMDAIDADTLWQEMLEALRPQMRSSLFKWFKPTQAVELADDTLVVSTPNTRTKDWMETGQLADTIQKTFAEVSKGKFKLTFVVQE